MRILLKVALIAMTSSYGPPKLSPMVIQIQQTRCAPADTIPYHMTTYVYKTVDTTHLRLDVFSPETANAKPCPAIILFHGGAWATGKRWQLGWQCRYFARQGIVAVTADYRLLGKDTGIIDAKSAIRWVKGHAVELGIDTGKLILGGGSAGGHLATMALLSKGHHDDPGDDLSISFSARALVLFNPAYSLDDAPSIEPFASADANFPPAIFFFGSLDKRWQQPGDSLCVQVKKAGVYCESWIADGQTHGFFRKAPWDLATCVRAQAFLARLGLMKPTEPTMELRFNTDVLVGQSVRN